MTSTGSLYARFKRALSTGNLMLVVTAAAELPRSVFATRSRWCLLLRDGDPQRYDRAAVRWAGRFALEAHNVTLEAIQAALTALDTMPDAPAEAMDRLARLCAQHNAS